MKTHRIRASRFLGRSLVEEFSEGKWKPAHDGVPLGDVVILPFLEYDAMRCRIAQAEARAEAQRKSRAAIRGANAALRAAQQPATEGQPQ